MPFMLPAAAASTALGTGAAIGASVGGAGLALGSGLAAGSALAGGAGIAGLMGGLGGAGALAPGAFGALAPGVASTIAPAAASQLAGTIGAGVAPGAFGANLAGASQGLIGTAGGVTPGAFGANLAGAGQGLGGAANQSFASQLAAAQNQANLTRQAMGAKDIIGGAAQKAADPLGTTYGTQVINGKTVTSSLPPFNAVTTPVAEASSLVPQAASGTGNLAETIRNTNTALRGNVPISYAEGAQGIAPNAMATPSVIQPGQNFAQNLGNLIQNPSWDNAKEYASEHPYATSAMAGLGAMGISKMLQPKKIPTPEDESMIRPYTYERTQRPEAYATSPTMDSSERNYFNDQFIAGEPYKAAEGGIAAAYAVGGAVEQMAAMNAVGANTGYPMANLQTPMYANPAMQRPEATNVVAPSADAGVGAYTGEPRFGSGGPVDTRPFFNPNTSGKSAEDYNRSELAGGRRAPIATPKTSGYSYSYDPNTMQFTQTSAPGSVTNTRSSTVGPGGGPAFMGPVGSGHYGAGSYSENARMPGNARLSGNAAAPMSTPANGTVTGGINTPAMNPMQPQQAAPAYPALNIPAYQSPEQQMGLGGFYDMMNQQLASYGGFSGYAKGGNVGGESHLGDYSDGGRLLKGPGDGVSDSIPASIGGRQPARLADGEFVVPARIVSELGNGSTEAGARKLYAMMERVQASRRKSIGKKKVAVNSKADKHLPA